MADENAFTRSIDKPTFRAVHTILSLLASIGAVVGIFYGAKTIQISTENERRQTTLNVLKPTREGPVLESLYRLYSAALEKKPIEDVDTERLALARNLLITTYDGIAVYYEFNVVDRCVVKAQVRPALDPIILSLEYFRTPQSAYARLVQLRKKLDELVCHDT